MRLPQTDKNNPEAIDQECFNKMVDTYMEKGFNYFDTSFAYHNGQSEVAIRKAVVERYPRDSFLICDKMPTWALTCEEDNDKFVNIMLERLGIDYFDVFFIHNINVPWLSLAEKHNAFEFVKNMKEKGIAAVTNPASNCKLASGIAPLSKFLAAGIPVGIGTDGPASNNCLDMFREMFLATALAKILENDAAALPAGSVLNMAITDGARIMGIPDADSLAEGKLADMILIDMQQPNMQPVSHIANNVVYRGSKLNVVMTVIGGNILYNRIPGSADAGRFDDRGFSKQLPAIGDIYAKAQSIRDRIIGE